MLLFVLNLSYRQEHFLTIPEYSRWHDFSLGDYKKGLKIVHDSIYTFVDTNAMEAIARV
jgi:hypothetical protein